MSTKHTPTPWHVMPDGDGLPLSIDSSIKNVAQCLHKPTGGFRMNSDCSEYEARANAALIVRAVNSHAELVAACERALERLNAANRARTEKQGYFKNSDIEAALAKAQMQ